MARPITHVHYQDHTQIKKIKAHIAFEQWPMCQKWGFTYNRRKNVRVWAQGIRRFLFCSSPRFKRTVGKYFFLTLLIVLISLFTAEKEVRNISHWSPLWGKKWPEAGLRYVPLEPECLALFLSNPLFNQEPQFPVKWESSLYLPHEIIVRINQGNATEVLSMVPRT